MNWTFFTTLAMLIATMPTWAGKLGEPKDIVFAASVDGTEQRYVELLPEHFEAGKEHHVLIALHGHGSDRWQCVSDPRDECRAARDIAARYDMIYISPDYRARTSWMNAKAEADLVQIIGDLRKKYRDGKVFLTGASMGGSAVLTFTALHPDLVAGVASLNGTANLVEYQNLQEAIAASFGGTKAEIPDEYKKRSAEFWPEKFTMPVAICAGGADASVPPQSVVRLANVLKAMKRPVLLIYRENGGHNTTYEDTMAGLEFVIRTALGSETISVGK
jgi:pimeloyl-ACP methyl ester carboxylesterase